MGVALLFLMLGAPALAGGNGGQGSGGGTMPGGALSGGVSHAGSLFGAPVLRTIVPPVRTAPAPRQPVPDRKPVPPPVQLDDKYLFSNTGMPRCPKNPYQQPDVAKNGCAPYPWVLYAFPAGF